MQAAQHFLMIRPVQFAFNDETAVNNSFQQKQAGHTVQGKALAEFDHLVNTLKAAEIDVMVMDDTVVPHTPDSIFPNNWISFHENGHVYLYPMFAENRRLERKQHVLDAIANRFQLAEVIDLSNHEAKQQFLEGTGSMVLDRDNGIAYACLSPRTHPVALHDFCAREHYRPVSFSAVDEQGQPIYHTNVMMCLAADYAVVCMESIHDSAERETLRDNIVGSGKELIGISMEQMAHFAGNMLQVLNRHGQPLLVMSTQAYKSLTPSQLNKLESYNPIVHADINTIETNGGGSARCMIAEVFLSSKKLPKNGISDYP